MKKNKDDLDMTLAEVLHALDNNEPMEDDRRIDANVSVLMGRGDYVTTNQDGDPMVRYLGAGSISSTSVRPSQYTASLHAVYSLTEGYKVHLSWGHDWAKAEVTIDEVNPDPKRYRREVETAKLPHIALLKAILKMRGMDRR